MSDPRRSDRLLSRRVCLAAAHAIFWGVVQPVNVEVMRWSLDAIPHDWENRRERWEYGHAIRAGLVTAALGALVTSVQSPVKSIRPSPAASAY